MKCACKLTSNTLEIYPKSEYNFYLKWVCFYIWHRNDIKLYTDFFPSKSFAKENGNSKAKLITSISMFYDLESPLDFVGEIAKILKQAQIFLFPSENEACSNTVIEALASGLPVLYHDSGGTPELCKIDKFGMALPKNNLNTVILNGFFDKVVNEFEKIRSDIINNIKLFNFKYCYNSYIQHFENLV